MSKLPRYYGIRKKQLISHLFIHKDKCIGEMPEDNSIISSTPDPAVYKEWKKKGGGGRGGGRKWESRSSLGMSSTCQRRPNMELIWAYYYCVRMYSEDSPSDKKIYSGNTSETYMYQYRSRWMCKLIMVGMCWSSFKTLGYSSVYILQTKFRFPNKFINRNGCVCVG